MITQLLAGVADAGEAERAVAGGVDILEIRADAPLSAILSRIAGRKPVCLHANDIALAAGQLPKAEIGVVRVGPDNTEFPRALLGKAEAIATLIADAEPDPGLLRALKAKGFAGVRLEAADGRRLLDTLTPDRIAAFVAACRERGLQSWLGGGLEFPDIARLLPHAPDVLCFPASLTEEAIALIRVLMPKTVHDRAAQASPGRAADARDSVPNDRVLVRDFVLPVSIGAYASERGKTQRVRFEVSVEVCRVRELPADMRHVFSYDIIVDTIRSVVAAGHIVLVETLAESIAKALLGHPAALAATVRVEKLDLGPGAVGVEIVRRRGT